jgi:hypothetical protein
MFSDRRRSTDRRKQNLPVPAGLDRRQGSRREHNFKAKPWWLQVDYSEELTSNKALSEAIGEIRRSPQANQRSDDHNKKL